MRSEVLVLNFELLTELNISVSELAVLQMIYNYSHNTGWCEKPEIIPIKLNISTSEFLEILDKLFSCFFVEFEKPEQKYYDGGFVGMESIAGKNCKISYTVIDNFKM